MVELRELHLEAMPWRAVSRLVNRAIKLRALGLDRNELTGTIPDLSNWRIE
jgi:hypothetical protein